MQVQRALLQQQPHEPKLVAQQRAAALPRLRHLLAREHERALGVAAGRDRHPRNYADDLRLELHAHLVIRT